MKKLVYIFYFSILIAFGFVGCDKSNAAVKQQNSDDANNVQVISETQIELIDTAFEIASKIPLEPHIKDRSRAQEKVVNTCIQLGLVDKAVKFSNQIKNWRKGSCYADIAIYFAKHGEFDKAKSCIELISTVKKAEQEWRNELILSKVAIAYHILDKEDKSIAIQESLPESKLADFVVDASDISFDAKIAKLDKYIATGGFEAINNSIRALVELLKNNYASSEKRTLIESEIYSSWDTIPLNIRIESLIDMAKIAIDNADSIQAKVYISKAQDFIDNFEWPLRHKVTMVSKLSISKFIVGDERAARNDIDSILDEFKKNKDQIVDIYRAEILCQLARSYHAMSDSQKAIEVLELAVEQAVINPNSRPQAIDISEICLTMASLSLEPGKNLWQQISEINNNFGEPW